MTFFLLCSKSLTAAACHLKCGSYTSLTVTCASCLTVRLGAKGIEVCQTCAAGLPAPQCSTLLGAACMPGWGRSQRQPGAERPHEAPAAFCIEVSPPSPAFCFVRAGRRHEAPAAVAADAGRYQGYPGQQVQSVMPLPGWPESAHPLPVAAGMQGKAHGAAWPVAAGMQCKRGSEATA